MKIEFFAPYVILMIKCRKMGWNVDVACMGEGRGAYRVLVGKR